MRPYGLCYLIPTGWEPLDGDPDTIARRLDERWSNYHLTPSARSRLLNSQLAAVEHSRAMGAVLWAAKHSGAGTAEDPLSVLSLSVAVTAPAARTAENVHEDDPPTPRPSSTQAKRTRRALSMRYGTLSGAIEERYITESSDSFDRPIQVFQAEAFVIPSDRSAVVTVTVTTTDPSGEGEAREVAERVASTLRFEPLEVQP